MRDAARQDELESLLRGREERARAQRTFLIISRQPCICQITLNIPGLPKKMDGEEFAVSLAARELSRKVGRDAKTSAVLVNGAGLAFFSLFPHKSPAELKKNAVEVEESEEWTRVLDIDVITSDGSVSRSALALPPRRCLLCGEEAKFCARSGAHEIQALREEASRLLSRSFNSVASAR